MQHRGTRTDAPRTRAPFWRRFWTQRRNRRLKLQLACVFPASICTIFWSSESLYQSSWRRALASCLATAESCGYGCRSRGIFGMPSVIQSSKRCARSKECRGRSRTDRGAGAQHFGAGAPFTPGTHRETNPMSDPTHIHVTRDQFSRLQSILREAYLVSDALSVSGFWPRNDVRTSCAGLKAALNLGQKR